MTSKSQSIQVSPIHVPLISTLQRYYDVENRTRQSASPLEVILEETYLCDFGVKFKVQLVRPEDGHGAQAVLYVAIPEWLGIRNPAVKRLTDIYDDSLCFDPKENGFNFSVVVGNAISKFDVAEEAFISLSQIRVQAIGAPILDALDRVFVEATCGTVVQSGDKVHTLSTHPRYGACHCVSSLEKTMIIFVVDVKDETERALARLFLTQFEVSQRTVAQSPHCDFRRAIEVPAELKRLVRGGGVHRTEDTIGFLSFTFFPFHVKTQEARVRATQLIVNFLPYLDKHIKSTKSYMHGRMRSKKDDLLRELKEVSSRSKKKVGQLFEKPVRIFEGLNGEPVPAPKDCALAITKCAPDAATVY